MVELWWSYGEERKRNSLPKNIFNQRVLLSDSLVSLS